MFFIGVVTDKNSENNIKNIMYTKNIKDSKIIFLNNENISNFKNVRFDSIVVNEQIVNESEFSRILNNSKYILLNTDIHCKSDEFKNIESNVITYGYNSKAMVTISSATEECYMFFVQDNICSRGNVEDIQEIKFEKVRNNINAYDGMIITIMDLLYNKRVKISKKENI